MLPWKVMDIDVHEPLRDIDGLKGYAGIWATLRIRGVPVAHIELPVKADTCSADTLRAAVRQHRAALVRYTVRQSLTLAPGQGSYAEADCPTISVVICTRGRPDELALCLEALCRQHLPPFEIIVVDNAPLDGTTERLVRERFSNCRYLQEPLPGLDRARNLGIEAAVGELVVFTDDDVIPEPGWLSAVASVFARQPHVMAVTGLVLPAALDTPAQLQFERYSGFGRGCQRQWFTAGGRFTPRLDHHNAGRFGTGANMAFRRRLLREIGLFDPALDVGTATGGGGDIEMFFRVLQAGFTLVYEPAAVVRHGHRPGAAALRKQIRAWGSGNVAFVLSSCRRFPQERGSFIRQMFSYLGHWILWRMLGVGRSRPVARALVLQELLGACLGPGRYLRALEESRRFEGEFLGDVVPAKRGLRRTGAFAIREIEITKPIPDIDDIAEYSAVRVYVRREGRPIGSVEIANGGHALTGPQLADSVSSSLTSALDILSGYAASSAVDDFVGQTSPQARSCSSELRESADPGITVVVCTRDRPAELERCLCALRQLRYTCYEVIVVDNASREAEQIRAIVQGAGFRYVREDRPGLNIARNRGAAAGRYDILAYVDDDAVADPNWLESLARAFARGDAGAVTGLVLPAEIESRAQRLFEAYGDGMSKGFGARVFDASGLALRDVIAAHKFGVGTNMAVRRSVLDSIGGFDPMLDVGTPAAGAGDIDLFHRLLVRGFRVQYEPSAVIWHHHRQDMDGLCKQVYQNGRSFGVYLLKLLSERSVPRREVIHFALTKWIPWCVGRVVLALVGLHRLPLPMVAAELLGALHSPWAYWAAVRRLASLETAAPNAELNVSPT